MGRNNVQDIEQSVTAWISDLKNGQPAAAQKLWESYFQRMVDMARRKLEGTPRAAIDEEDVALSAFKSFCLRARQGQFTQLTDRENLWPLLMAITANKSVDLIRQQNARKRGGTGQTGEADGWQHHPLSELISVTPDPQFAAQLADELQSLLTVLDEAGDPQLKQIALQKMEGHSSPEIAKQLQCARRTVERKLLLIGRLWAAADEQSTN